MNGFKMRRILTIDGGGLKGTIPAAFLAAIEEQTKRPLYEYFDLIVGTSTGGIIAAGLAMGMSAREILEIYEKDGPHIFPTTTCYSRALIWIKGWVRAKYPTSVLRSTLTRHFGATRIGEARTRLVIPSWEPEGQTVHVWKTRHCGRFRFDHKRQVVEALVSTASAPTYFASSLRSGGTGLIDGGIWANNPMYVAAVEALGVLKWRPEALRVLALGCVREDYVPPDGGGRLRWAPVAPELFLQAQSRSSLASTCLLLNDRSNPPERIFRIEASAPKDHFQLDNASQIPTMRSLGESLARRYVERLQPIFFGGPATQFVPLPDEADDAAIS
jgi:hypothetical protein